MGGHMNRSRETRLGIVLYGGVSLAVYENGVAQELFRATRGEPKKAATPYDLVKAIADTDIVVDILSGTSAGGINGIMLAYALANAKDFRPSAALWRDKGDIMALLRKPDEENVSSVLDSRGYYQTSLENAFRVMDDHPFGAPYESEIDLFVTGTDVHGRVFTEFDDQGHPIDVKDHRSVFLLSYRPDRKNEFSPKDTIPALAKLARITSCFPVAFEPVHVCNPAVPGATTTPAEVTTDKLLWRWGQLTHDAYFLDGGLLDNKPFSYTIDAIFGRLAERDVDRMLLYVEPDPEQFNDEALPETPNVVKAAGDALIGIPGYESIAGDLQDIARRNTKLARYHAIRSNLKNLPAVNDTLAQAQGNPLAPLGDITQARVGIYLSARLTQMRDRAIVGILKKSGALRLLSGTERHAAKMLVDSFAAWPGDGTGTLEEFDVYYRLRRLYYSSYTIRELLYRRGPVAPESAVLYGDVRRRLNHQIKLLEIVKYVMGTVLDDSAIPVSDLASQTTPDPNAAAQKWAAVQNLMRRVLAATPELGSAGTRQWGSVTDPQRLAEERAQRERFMTALRSRMEGMAGADGSAPAPAAGNLLHDLDRQEREILQLLPPGDVIRVDYCRFILIDSYLFPIESMGEIESKDSIRTVRISPIDDRFGFGANKIVADKLCGRMLGHFGGFMKSSWRANDIMWGRLDGISQLVQCIVTPERILSLRDNGYDAWAALASSDLMAKLFPNTPAGDLQQLEEDLKALPALAQEHFDLPREAGVFSRFEAFQDRFIRAAQTEILEEEIPQVLQMAIDQQIDWNQYSVHDRTTPFRAGSQSWEVGVRQIDPAVLSVARRRLVEMSANSSPGQWTEFLASGEYQVAAESLANGVPKPVLLEIAAHSALVLENCLTGVAGMKKSDAIRSNPLFRLGVHSPLRAIYDFAVFQRTAPEFARSISVAVLALSLAALTAGIVWWNQLIHVNGTYNLRAFGLLMVAPVVALLVQTFAYGRLRSASLILLLPIAAGLAALGMMNAGILHFDPNDARWFVVALHWLQAQSAPIWTGAGAALLTAIPFRALRGEIRAWLYDRRHGSRPQPWQQRPPQPPPRPQPPEQPQPPKSKPSADQQKGEAAVGD